MSDQHLYRLNGLALMTGAIVAFLMLLYTGLFFIGHDPKAYVGNAAFVPVNLLLAGGAALVLVGLPGMFKIEANSVVGLVGMVLVFITGLMFGVFFSLLLALVFPYLNAVAPAALGSEPPPSFGPFFIFGGIAQVVGLALLGVAILRGPSAQRWTGYVLVAAAAVGVADFIVSGPSGPSNVVANVFDNLSPLLLMIAVAGLGYDMWARSKSSLVVESLRAC